MSRKIAIAHLMLCMIFLAEAAHAQKARTPLAQEQTAFYEDSDPNPFWDSVPLPENVLDLLRVSEEAKLNSEQLKGLDRGEFNKLFTALEIHLGTLKEQDYLVLGKRPMAGADSAWFWIVRFDPIHPEIILFANGNGVELSEHRSNGYRNIRSVWSSAAGYTITRVYKFDGKKYRLWKELRKTDKTG